MKIVSALFNLKPEDIGTEMKLYLHGTGEPMTELTDTEINKDLHSLITGGKGVWHESEAAWSHIKAKGRWRNGH